MCLKGRHVSTYAMSFSSSRFSNTYTDEDMTSLFKIAVSLRMTYPRSNFVTLPEICHSGKKKTFHCVVHSVKDGVKILILPEMVCRNFLMLLQMVYFFRGKFYPVEIWVLNGMSLEVLHLVPTVCTQLPLISTCSGQSASWWQETKTIRGFKFNLCQYLIAVASRNLSGNEC